MIGNSQRLQGYRSYGVRRAISSTPSKVTGLRRLQRSLSDKFQRYSPNFDIIIIIIILEVDIKGCEVAKVSGFHRAIFTHITCHYCGGWSPLAIAHQSDSPTNPGQSSLSRWPFYWRGPRVKLIALMSVIPSWNRLDERIQMSVVLKLFTKLPRRKKFSNGVIFTHPRIFRRFLADISETVPLR